MKSKSHVGVAAQLQSLTFDALQQLELLLPTEELEIYIEHPSDTAHGDFSTNIALQLFPQLSEFQKSQYPSPRALASALVEVLLLPNSALTKVVQTTEVAGPGFINFFLKDSWLLSEVKKILSQKNSYGKSDSLKGMRISVEYTDPNPFKEFHIGHLYSNIVGESLATLHECMGATVWRGDFFGDVGMHVAKSIWGLLQKFEEDGLSVQGISTWLLPQRIEYFGQAYARGASAYKDNASAKSEMEALNFLIFKAAQELILPQYHKKPEIDFEPYIKPSKYSYSEIKEIYLLGRTWSLEYFETIYQRLGTKFDAYYPESLTGEFGYKIVLEGLQMGYFEKGEGGAIIFPGEKYGLHNRVFINSLGLPTYETKDFGLAQAKYEDFPYDLSYNVTGNEINDYFQVVLMALKKVRPELGEKTVHVGHGMVRLPEGKMSSRTGKILRGEWLLDAAKEAANEILAEDNDFNNFEKDALSERIALGAIKYALLKQNIGEDIAFDFKKSISFSGNSGPYLQYTFARSRSILRKSKKETRFDLTFDSQKLNEEERAILKWLYRFPEILSEATTSYSPHIICTYLYELAQRFNSFYNKHSVLEDSPSQEFRLQMTEAVSIIIQNGLQILGIEAPEKM